MSEALNSEKFSVESWSA